MKNYLITGGAGFIGSHLVDALLSDPETGEVKIIDNISSGKMAFLKDAYNHPKRPKGYKRDLLILTDIVPLFAGVDTVFHLAANPDARRGITNTRLDLEQETIVTYNVLEAMRLNKVPRIVFSSSGTVYGDIGMRSASESNGPLLPISLYGAGKLACEGLISAFCGTFGMQGIIYRFGNVLGERATHGAVFDWINQLKQDKAKLNVLGNGNQSKPYIYVKDIVQALLFARQIMDVNTKAGECRVFNVAPDGGTSVKFMAETLVSALGLSYDIIKYQDSDRGWAGDVPQSRMNSSRLSNIGFQLVRSSDAAVKLAIQNIVKETPELTTETKAA